MQISTLIIAPAFSTAALYVILGVLVKRLGERYCRLTATSTSPTLLVFVPWALDEAPAHSPRRLFPLFAAYTVIFVVGDILSVGRSSSNASDLAPDTT